MTELAKTIAFELAPGDLRAEARPKQGLIRRAGEGGRAAKIHMRLHEPLPVRSHLVRTAKELGVDEIERADVEACRHAHLAAEGGHALDKIEARLAEIEASVDVGLLDGDEGARFDRFSEADQEPHGEGRRGPMRAACEIPVEVRKFERHSRQARTNRVAMSPHSRRKFSLG